jgi:hypothetical protein
MSFRIGTITGVFIMQEFNHVSNIVRKHLSPLICLAFIVFLGACAEAGPENMPGGDDVTGQSVPGQTEGDEASDDLGSAPEDTTPTDEPSGPPPCAEIEAQAANLHLPVDILWAIDSSGSMSDEIELIQERMDGFVEFMETTGIDYRVLLLAGEHESAQSFNVCLPPPLSSVDSCPDQDGPRYRHVDTHVDSFNALRQFVEHYDNYSDFLRPDAAVHMVVVSDDESDLSASQFLINLRELGHQPFIDNLTVHSVASEPEEMCILGFCWDGGCSGPYGNAANAGNEYIELSEQTGGIFSNICSAEWDPIFASMAESVLASTRMPCAFELPETPDGLVVDYESVTISFESEDGAIVDLERVFSQDECGLGKWHYDDHSSPSYIKICSESCGEIFGSLEITIGCEKG